MTIDNNTDRKDFFIEYIVPQIVKYQNIDDLLENKNYKIQDVSERVGFQDVTHFCRIFKSYVGKSPSDYRNYGGKGK